METYNAKWGPCLAISTTASDKTRWARLSNRGDDARLPRGYQLYAFFGWASCYVDSHAPDRRCVQSQIHTCPAARVSIPDLGGPGGEVWSHRATVVVTVSPGRAVSGVTDDTVESGQLLVH